MGGLRVAFFLYAFLWSAVVLLSGVEGVPRSVYLLNLILVMQLVWGSRMAARWLFTPRQLNHGSQRNHHRSRVIIYGAGRARDPACLGALP